MNALGVFILSFIAVTVMATIVGMIIRIKSDQEIQREMEEDAEG